MENKNINCFRWRSNIDWPANRFDYRIFLNLLTNTLIIILRSLVTLSFSFLFVRQSTFMYMRMACGVWTTQWIYALLFLSSFHFNDTFNTCILKSMCFEFFSHTLFVFSTLCCINLVNNQQLSLQVWSLRCLLCIWNADKLRKLSTDDWSN